MLWNTGHRDILSTLNIPPKTTVVEDLTAEIILLLSGAHSLVFNVTILEKPLKWDLFS